MTNVIDAIHQHRSIRKYKPDPVPDEILADILQAGVRASSSGNMQTYSIIVTQDRVLREQLYGPHMEQNMVLDAPVLLTFCAVFRHPRQPRLFGSRFGRYRPRTSGPDSLPG